MANIAPQLPPMPPRRTSTPDNGLAAASLTLGILAIITSPCLVGGALGLIGIVTGLVHLNSRQHARPMAVVGMVLSVVGMLVAGASIVVWLRFVPLVREQMASMENMTKRNYSEWIGVRAPDMTLNTADGKEVTLSALKGKRVIVEVFQTWDPDCREQAKSMAVLDTETNDGQLAIVGITRTGQDDVEDYLQETGIHYPYAITDDAPRPYSDVDWFPTTFFIDRNGVIDAITVAVNDLESLRRHATAPDYTAEVLDVPRAPKSELTLANPQLEFEEVWSVPVKGARTLCAGDWNGDGNQEVLVCDAAPTLHIIDAAGHESTTTPLPENFSMASSIAFGRHKTGGARLLGLQNFGQDLTVADVQGQPAWTYSATFGIDGARWVDLDGDGSDEVIAGMNGFGGVHAITADGKSQWKTRSLTNVWGQAAVSAEGDSSARIYVTEASGQIIELDHLGNKVRNFATNGRYFTSLSAAVVDDEMRVQIMGLGDAVRPGQARIVAFDERGAEEWSTPSTLTMNDMREAAFAFGDANGDAVVDWLIRDGSRNLTIVSPDGEQLSTIRASQSAEQFCVLPVAEGRPLVIVLGSYTVSAFRAEPVTTTPPVAEAPQS